jgi:hypothetical protein
MIGTTRPRKGRRNEPERLRDKICMTITLKTIILAAGLALIAAGQNAASAASEADLPPKQAAVKRLQEAVRTNDKAWIAGHARYPVNYFGRRRFVIRNKASLIGRYAALFGAKLRAAVLAQDPADVFENAQGLMIGEGSYNIWIRDTGDGTTERYQIITINDGP